MNYLKTLIGQVVKNVTPARKEMTSSQKNELFIAGMTRTNIFSKMSIQDQIISLSKMIGMFERDYGYMPQRPSQVLTKLNNQLNSRVAANFGM